MSKTTKSVLDQIKSGTVTQHSAGYFFGWRIALWTGLTAVVALGIIAWAMVFHFANNMGFLQLVLMSPRDGLRLLWFGLPLLWIVLFVAAIVTAVTLAQHTKRGYRIAPVWWIGLLLVPQIVLGYALEQGEIGQKIDTQITRFSAQYNTPDRRREQFWDRPKQGFLVGHVQAMTDNELTVEALNGQLWQVQTKHIPPRLQIGAPVHIRGDVLRENVFEAKRIHRDLPPPRRPKPRPRRP